MKSSRRTWRTGSLSSIFFSLFLLIGAEIVAQESYNQSAEFRIAHGYFQQAKALYREGRYGSAVQLLEAFLEFFPDSSGNFTRTVFYAASMPVQGIRDLDGDGEPEIREEFRNGRLWKITLDQDGDGVNEFEQIFEGDSNRIYWDYNDDGLYDSREFAGSDGTLARGVSPLLNGAYDLTESGGDLR